MRKIVAWTSVFAPITKNQEEKAEALNRTRNTEEKSQKGEKPEVSKEKKNAEDRSSRKIIAAKKEKKESPRRRGRRAGRDGHSAVKRRRAVVYHDDGQAGAPDIHGGRRGSSGSVDDYVKGDRGSSSDEYKRRVHEIREKYREEKAAEEEDSKKLV
ncbi:hypothetical protein Y032_0100g3279 [Ancylostoma ceylanicum]|uniref:Uncharacterized protein n=1 Tax=Ancylostoma ceylanicum TaxID=53326 RepID=A0A016TI64_9BILA|nr:hypothetical protein Y032_0100g3279 [Ancylostoma ceylanicum]